MEANQVIRRFLFLSAVLVFGFLASGSTIAYAGGDRPEPTLTLTPQPTSTPTRPDALSSVSGRIEGNRAGSSKLHTITMPDADRTTHIMVTLTQVSRPCLLGNRDGKNEPKFYVAISSALERRSTDAGGCMQQLLIENTGREVNLQVDNYHDQLTVQYRLELDHGTFSK